MSKIKTARYTLKVTEVSAVTKAKLKNLTEKQKDDAITYFSGLGYQCSATLSKQGTVVESNEDGFVSDSTIVDAFRKNGII